LALIKDVFVGQGLLFSMPSSKEKWDLDTKKWNSLSKVIRLALEDEDGASDFIELTHRDS